MIAPLDVTAINDLREALPRATYFPLAHLPHLSFEQRRAYWLDEIRQSLAEETSIAFRKTDFFQRSARKIKDEIQQRVHE